MNAVTQGAASPPVDQVRVRVLPDGRMDRRNATKYLGNSVKTLAMWTMEGKGPDTLLVGGRRFYFKEVLDAFIRGGVVSGVFFLFAFALTTLPTLAALTVLLSL